jgi:hypothetical protein
MKDVNSLSFKALLKARRDQMEHIRKMYDTTPWKNIAKQQLETQRVILNAHEKINTTGLIEYRKFLKNNFYSNNIIDIKQATRTEVGAAKASIKELCKKTVGGKTLLIIKEVRQVLDLQSDEKFEVF